MVEHPAEGQTVADIATRYGVDITTVRNTWCRHPDWPAPTGKHGRWFLYDPAAVDTWHRTRNARPPAGLLPDRQYTTAQIEQATGFTAANVRAELSKGRWPTPEGMAGRANTWSGATVEKAIAARRAYNRTAPVVSPSREDLTMDDDTSPAAEERGRASTVSAYRHRPAGPGDGRNVQQQAAAARAAVEKLGLDVVGFDGVELS